MKMHESIVERQDKTLFEADLIPVISSQERLWVISQTAKSNVFSNHVITCAIDSHIHIENVERLVNNLIRLFPLLHAKLVLQGDKWFWQKQPVEQPQLTIHQCQSESFDEYLTTTKNQWHNVADCTPLQAKLVELGADDRRLVLSIPYLVCDKTSSDMLRYMVANSGLCRVQASDMDSPPETEFDQSNALICKHLLADNVINSKAMDAYFADFAQGFEAQQNSESLAKQRQFWADALSQDTPRLDLPFDKPRQSVQNFSCRRESFVIDKAHFAQFQAKHPQCHDAYVYLLTAVSLVLHRYTQQQHFSLGLLGSFTDNTARVAHFLEQVNAKKTETDHTALLGQFDNFNTLICCLDNENARQDLHFADVYHLIESQLSNLNDNNDIAFENVLKQVSTQRNVNLSPLFQVLVVNQLNKLNDKNTDLAQSFVADELKSPFDLTINLNAEDDSNFYVSIDYNRDLFYASTVANFTQCFQVLLNAVAQSSSQSISTLPLLTEKDADQQLHFFQQSLQAQSEGNNDSQSHSKRDALYDVFAQNVAVNSASTALIFNGETLTYAQLHERVEALSTELHEPLNAASHFIGVALPRGIDFVVSVLAILKVGKAYVPMDPKQPVQHLQFIVDDAQLSHILVAYDDVGAESVNSKLHALYGAQLLDVQRLSQQAEFAVGVKPEQGASDVQHAESGANANTAEQNPKRQDPATQNTDSANATQSGAAKFNENADAAYVIYTSGSKGKAKAVVGSQRSVLNRLAWMERTYPSQDHDVLCHRTPVNFVDHVAEIFQAFYCAKPLLIVPEDSFLDCENVIRLLREHKVTRITLVPSLLQLLLDTGFHTLSEQLDYVFSSGDALTLGLAQRFFTKCWNTRLINVYGSTECGADICYHEVQFGDCFQLMDLFSPTPGLDDDPILSGLSDVQSMGQDNILPYTKANVALDALLPKFMSTELRDMPMSLASYKDLLKLEVLPYSVNVSSGKFIGHMTSALPDFIGELSSTVAQLNQNMVKIETSKAFTLLERQVLATLHRLFFQRDIYGDKVQDPNFIYGLVVSGGSIANITAMWCARNRALMKLGASKDDIRELGFAHLMMQYQMKDSVIICSRLAHYSVKKAASLMGLGERNILRINQTEDQKVDVAHLAQLVAECRREKRLVIAIIGIAGATETGIFDPIPDMGNVARENDVHFHVDAAWGGALAFSNQYRSKLAGVSEADSITFCAHKQMYVPQGVSVCLFNDPTLIHASSVHASYQGQQGSFDLGQYTLEGSRPAISVTLHAALNVLSKDQLAWLIDQGIKKAEYFGKVIDQSEEFELIASPEINILNYRYIPKALRRAKTDPQRTTYDFSAEENAHISEVVKRIQEQQFLNGKTFVSKTTIAHPQHQDQPIIVFRVVLANPLTKYEDLHANLFEQIKIANDIIEQDDVNVLPAIAPTYKENEQVRQLLPIGKPIDNCAVYILDNHLQLLPQGAIGEIYVSGAGLSLGYLNEEDNQDGQFVPHPFHPGEMLYRTGDMGRYLANETQDKGQAVIQFLGRKDDQVKINGVRIELIEVESYLSRLPEIKECKVVAHGTSPSDKKLIAFWVRSDSASGLGLLEDTASTLRNKLLEFTPTYLIPNEFVEQTQLPKSVSGKVMDSTLVQSLEPGQEEADELWQTRTESTLGKMWAELLNKESVNRQDSFFSLGGDSIAAAKLLVLVRKTFNLDIPFFKLFESDYLKDMATNIDNASI